MATEHDPHDKWEDLFSKHQTIDHVGQHLCWLYKTDEDHKRVVFDYIKKGYHNNEKILYIARTHARINEIKRFITENGLDAEAMEAKGQLIFKEALEVYVHDGRFDPDYMIELLKEDVKKSLAEGYTGLRGSGEMNWCLGDFAGTDRIFEYEAKLNLFFRECPHFVGMCQYDMRSFQSPTLLKVLNTHPYAIRDSEIFDNFYYIPPEEFLSQDLATVTLHNWLNNLALRKADEQKIFQKTAELRQANESIANARIEKERIQHAKSLAEAQNEAKSLFLHHMSHEMRTPLNGILGTCSILEQQYKTEAEKESVSTIKDCADHLLTVIKDILDLALIESGKMVLNYKPMGVGNCLDSVYKILGENKTVTYTIDKDVPTTVLGDITRVKQVLLNLISNGIKFSGENAKVEVNVNATNITATNCTLHFSVKDNGIGIKPDQFSALFKPFSQVDNTVTRKFDGTGLGLSICKKIVEAMNGTIWLESAVGQGSTFYFNVPAEIPPKAETPKLESPSSPIPQNDPSKLRVLNVLVVEDNLVNQKLVCRMITKLGHKVATAINGVKAIEAVKREDYNVIFMDLNMPEMGGIEASTIITAMDWSKSQRPSIVALTACAFKEDRVNCLHAGMEDFITKPFTLKMIQNVLDHYIETHPASQM